MNTITTNQTNFKSIKLTKGGIEFLKKDSGEKALRKYYDIKDHFNRYQWKLNIDENGYSFESPRNSKKYNGPFTIKKMLKNGKEYSNNPRIVVRMNDSGRAKYVIACKNTDEVRALYKKFKNANGFEKMLLLLATLEKCFKDTLLI